VLRLAAQQTEKQVKAAGSSFYWAMRMLKHEKRAAMYALYAYCRILDDIVDTAGARRPKQEQLETWENLIKQPATAALPADFTIPEWHATATCLNWARRTYGLDADELHMILQGMAHDTITPVFPETFEDLRVYCRQVAGAVGVLILQILGQQGTEAVRFAETVGEALQFTNILRDIHEDAMIGRIYLPKAWAPDLTIQTILRQPDNTDLCDAIQKLAEITRHRYQRAHEMAAHFPTKDIRPTLLMMEAYRLIFNQLEKRGFAMGARPKISKWQLIGKGLKIWITS
jgi:phytoene synthase